MDAKILLSEVFVDAAEKTDLIWHLAAVLTESLNNFFQIFEREIRLHFSNHSKMKKACFYQHKKVVNCQFFDKSN